MERDANRNLLLATVAFAACFSAWGMLAPLGPKLQDELGLSNTETAIMIAIPVRARLVAADPARSCSSTASVVASSSRRCSPTRPARRSWSASPPAMPAAARRRPPARRRRRLLRGRRAVRRRAGSEPSGRATRSASTASATSAPPSRPSRCRRSATRRPGGSPGSSSAW